MAIYYVPAVVMLEEAFLGVYSHIMRSNAIQRCISDGIAILMLIEIEMQHITDILCLDSNSFIHWCIM